MSKNRNIRYVTYIYQFMDFRTTIKSKLEDFIHIHSHSEKRMATIVAPEKTSPIDDAYVIKTACRGFYLSFYKTQFRFSYVCLFLILQLLISQIN